MEPMYANGEAMIYTNTHTHTHTHARTAMEKQMKDELNEKVPVSGKSKDKTTAKTQTDTQTDTQTQKTKDAVSSSASCKALSVSTALNNLRAFALKARPKLFVFSFNGDPLPSSPLEFLSKLINLLIICASPYDEVVVRLTSPGGLVAHYGLAAAQLHRLKKAGIKLTVCVDTVAASGGYMMACVADTVCVCVLCVFVCVCCVLCVCDVIVCVIV